MQVINVSPILLPPSIGPHSVLGLCGQGYKTAFDCFTDGDLEAVARVFLRDEFAPFPVRKGASNSQYFETTWVKHCPSFLASVIPFERKARPVAKSLLYIVCPAEPGEPEWEPPAGGFLYY